MQQLSCFQRNQLLEFPLEWLYYNITGSSTIKTRVFCCTELNAIKFLYGCLILSTFESVVCDPHLPSLCQIIVVVHSLTSKLQIPLKRCFVGRQVNETEMSKCLSQNHWSVVQHNLHLNTKLINSSKQIFFPTLLQLF